MSTSRGSPRSQGHTLLELMVAIVIGMLLVLAAFQVMATFEGNKRTTTATNDALQSGNIGMYELDKMVRSSATGVARYGAVAGFGCAINYTPSGGTLVTSGVLPTLPAPFATVFSASGASAMRLAPAVIFPGVSAGGSDVLMTMLGGSGYGEAPIPVTEVIGGGATLSSIVGFNAGDWVLVGTTGIADCMITQVASSYAYSATNVFLPLVATTVGAFHASTNNLVMGLGAPAQTNFQMYGVGTDDALWSLDLLNSNLGGGTAQKVGDDIVAMKAVYGVFPPTATGTSLTWTNPVTGVNIGGTNYDYSPKGLLLGNAAANTALKSIRAIRLAVVVRAPLLEKSAANLATSLSMFSGLSVATTWTSPGGAYRYQELETTIPVRNVLF